MASLSTSPSIMILFLGGTFSQFQKTSFQRNLWNIVQLKTAPPIVCKLLCFPFPKSAWGFSFIYFYTLNVIMERIWAALWFIELPCKLDLICSLNQAHEAHKKGIMSPTFQMRKPNLSKSTSHQVGGHSKLWFLVCCLLHSIWLSLKAFTLFLNHLGTSITKIPRALSQPHCQLQNASLPTDDVKEWIQPPETANSVKWFKNQSHTIFQPQQNHLPLLIKVHSFSGSVPMCDHIYAQTRASVVTGGVSYCLMDGSYSSGWDERHQWQEATVPRKFLS